jgi:hypothetical protein
MAPRLKVFATRIGFHDVVVAAPSQKAALTAWDVRENLFGQGAAAVAEDPKARKAALAQPGVVLSRAIGETGDFHAEARTPAQAPKPPAAARTAKADKASKATRPPRTDSPRPKPDRGPLTAAERALADLDAEGRRLADGFARERRAIDAKQAGQDRELATQRRRLERERDRVLRVYTRAMGE